jgi:asparagine synthase (glutamine-hydrolysing)
MCGIAGVIDFSNKLTINENLLREMAIPLVHRGPDQDGYALFKDSIFSFGLAHKRLSIIDLSDSGKQPMWSADGRIVLTFNGEIYNYLEIKNKLQLSGCLFSSTSDTEVIIHAYLVWGIEKTLKLLEGMFSFVLVDLSSQTSFIVRDRFGEKPLYYYYEKGQFSFSSDIRSFKSLDVPLSLDLHALGYYFAELTTPVDDSIYLEIKKLRPASYLVLTQQGLKQERYWEIAYKEKNSLRLSENVEKAEYLLEKAVNKTLISDVPVGCFLSGGLDSSLVSLFAAKKYDTQIKTFSVGFDYAEFNELPYAKKVAKQIGSEHNEIILNSNDLSIVDRLLEEYGEPFADSSAIPTFYVSKFASENVKVVLGGDGGDEIFAGYRTYNQGLRMQQWYNKKFLSTPFRVLKSITNSKKVAYLNGVINKDVPTLASALYRNMGFSDSGLKELFNHKDFYNASKIEHEKAIKEGLKVSDDVFDVLLHGSIKTRLVNDYLVKTDRASMFNSLELRTPFLDKDLVEFASTIPYKHLMHGGVNKFVTKKIAEKHFSKDLIYRKKQGFGIPVGIWMKNEWRSNFEEVVFEEQDWIPLNYKFVNKIWKEHLDGQKDHTHRLWALYVFHKWVKTNR